MERLEDFLPEDSWLREWMDCWPLSESPRSFILLAGMSAIGAALGRRLFMRVGHKILYPMLNIILVGPSGVGKTESIMMAQKYLLSRIPREREPLIMEGEATHAKLHVDLADHPNAVIIAEEMAVFFSKQKYQEDMIPFVTELLNYKDKIQRRTISKDVVDIVKPEVTFMCGTTPDWLQKQMPNAAVAGGFLPRFLVAYEEQKSQIVPFPYVTAERQAALDEQRAHVGREYLLKVLPMEGEVKFKDFEAIDKFTEWYTEHKPATGHLAAFAERAREFVMRLSIIIAVSRGHRDIDYIDVGAAIKIYEWVTAQLQKVVVPYTPEGELLNKVLELFRSPADILSEKQVKRAMRNYMRADNVVKNIDSLLASGDLVRTTDGKLKRNFK